jgi:hypothetical protein
MTRTQYLLTVLAEEAAEVAKEAIKAARFGIDDAHPRTGETNRQRLTAEFNDLVAVMEMVKSDLGLKDLYHGPAIATKQARVQTYMEYSKERGMVEC